MSNYEGMNGRGLVMKKDLAVLKKALIAAHNKQIAKLKPKQLKENGLAKASIRTTSFPIICEYDENDFYDVGYINIYPETGEFTFEVNENNHSMDDADRSFAFNALFDFIRKIPNKGKKYGAQTYYWSEYDEDEYGNKGPGRYSYYGSWTPKGIFY